MGSVRMSKKVAMTLNRSTTTTPPVRPPPEHVAEPVSPAASELISVGIQAVCWFKGIDNVTLCIVSGL